MAGVGKVEDLRAIKDARYAAQTAAMRPRAPIAVPVAARVPAAATAPASAAPAVLPAPGVAAAQTVATDEPLFAAEPEPADARCGHRAIGGKTCIRERGHDEASHKYAKG